MDRISALTNLYQPAKLARYIIADGIDSKLSTSLSTAVYQALSQTYETVKADAELHGQLSEVVSTRFESAVATLRTQIIKREEYWQSLGEQSHYYTLVSLVQSVGHLQEELRMLTIERQSILSNQSPLLTTHEWKRFVSHNAQARKIHAKILEKLIQADSIISKYRQSNTMHSSYIDTEVGLLDAKVSDYWAKLHSLLAQFA